jgi:uncharacterized membrane protein YvbJ
MSHCKKCGLPIEPPFKYCDKCGDEIAAQRGQLHRRQAVVLRRRKQAADVSGNAKIYLWDECSQEFLKSLIPEE